MIRTIASKLLILITLSALPHYSLAKPAHNAFQKNNPNKVEAIEKIIQQKISLYNDSEHNGNVVLAKNYATTIRNPIINLSSDIYAEMSKQGINLKEMSAYKALYISGHLTGASSKKSLILTQKRSSLLVRIP